MKNTFMKMIVVAVIILFSLTARARNRAELRPELPSVGLERISMSDSLNEFQQTAYVVPETECPDVRSCVLIDRCSTEYTFHPEMQGEKAGFLHGMLHRAYIGRGGWANQMTVRPTVSQFFITPLMEGFMWECFQGVRDRIVSRGYLLFGSPLLGSLVAFICDPVNEAICIIGGGETRRELRFLSERGFSLRSMPWRIKAPAGLGSAYGIAVSLVF